MAQTTDVRFGTRLHTSEVTAWLCGKADPALREQLWLRVAGVAVAVSVALMFGASADAGPVGATARTAGSRFVSAGTPRAGNEAAAGSSLPTAAASPSAALSPERSLAAALSVRQLAGQRVIYSYSGLTPPASLLRLIRRGEVGGVIFFGANFSGRAQFTAAVGKLEAANASKSNPASGYPLLLMTDQEGGEVRRLPGAPVHSEKWIGSRATASARAFQARTAGTGAGQNLLSYGLNLNLAPVLDVYRAPGDFDDQFQRSYSMNPDIVSTLGATFIRAQQATGVAATAKHFPGLGAATAGEDTDDVPVTISLSRKALQGVDEYPYRAAIHAGVKLVMVSWARYPALGSDRPAGLSSVIVQGQLRRRLGFPGVTITDSIGAGALASFGPTQNRALLAAEAGMQLILAASETPGQGEQCLAALESGYQDGNLPKAAFQATVAQILQLRAGLPAL